MGFDFCNDKGGEISLHGSRWRTAFRLARVYGWHPAGTEPAAGPPEGVKVVRFDMRNAVRIDAPASLQPPDPELGDDSWPGYYFYNDRQQVSETDARALATALERAMPELPNEDLCPCEKLKLFDGHGQPIELEVLTDDAEDDPKLYWSGSEKKAYLQKFIDFCRQGRFAIG